MNRDRRRIDRLIRYGADPLGRAPIHIEVKPSYARTYEGQVAALVSANLFARLCSRVTLNFPDVAIVEGLPWTGMGLEQVALTAMTAADPCGEFGSCVAPAGAYRIRLGPWRTGRIVDGRGWYAYAGPAPSPLEGLAQTLNPVGAAFAVVSAAAHAFVCRLGRQRSSFFIDCLAWAPTKGVSLHPQPDPRGQLGEIWAVGAGSVGTSALYFLALYSREFSCRIFDMDTVELENITRSPIFAEGDVGIPKVDATLRFLTEAGVKTVTAVPTAFGDSEDWATRAAGHPDVLISAANERGVRSQIEAAYPPVQIYGTTGRNWNSTLVRHVPLVDPCSCCLFPPREFAETVCATGQVEVGDRTVDASLPFLSFAAGLMASAEIMKLGLAGYPFTANRVAVSTKPELRLVQAGMRVRPGCPCRSRSGAAYRRILSGSNYAGLSTVESSTTAPVNQKSASRG